MIYVHVPFCATHCTYCAFYSELLHTPRVKGSDAVCAAGTVEDYVEALCREIAAERDAVGACRSGLAPVSGGMPDADPDTLYFGGGTPSLLSVEQVGRILDALRRSGLLAASLDEFTFEVNPEDIVEKGSEYASGLRKLGVNRISMGVQSFDDAILRRMGRRHRSAGSREAYRILREAGFDNISIDLILGFGKDSEVASLRDNLREFSGVGNVGGNISAVNNAAGGLPEHISCYQLGVEEGSGLEKMLERGLWSLPGDYECAQRYETLCRILGNLGYEHYEISNWALPGRRSRHNSAYWRHLPYLGLGPGAHSLFVSGNPVRYVRRWNNPDLAVWRAAACAGNGFAAVRGEETLTEEQLFEERLFLGLRASEGIPEELLPVDKVEMALSEGSLVRSDDGRLRIPEDKWFISDNIIQKLI